jgi:hypothetical protein
VEAQPDGWPFEGNSIQRTAEGNRQQAGKQMKISRLPVQYLAEQKSKKYCDHIISYRMVD